VNQQTSLYLIFANLLEYPTSHNLDHADECLKLLEDYSPGAAEEFSCFYKWVKKKGQSHVEEIYTSTFDLQGVCCLYVGHYLFGDNHQRSLFMATLNKEYAQKGFSCSYELPDHVSVILRFLARGDRDEFSQVLMEEGLLPSVLKMVETFNADGAHPYMYLLKSLSLFLHDEQQAMQDSLVKSEAGGL
jgi:nitrate reductase delta subunit